MKPFIPKSLPIQGVNYQAIAPYVSRANLALGNYNAFLSIVSSSDMFISPLMRQEALDSNRIEGSQSTLNDVLSFEADEGSGHDSEISDDLREIFNYRMALKRAESEFLAGRPFSLNLLQELHYILLDSVRGRNKARGEFRHLPGHQNWIGRRGSTLETASFVPPEPGKVAEYLDKWEKYYHSEEPDPLVQLALIHAQFELIHPFLDGNGRTGRMLIPLFLYEKGIISKPAFYISSYLEQHRLEYLAHLEELGKENSDWNEWIIFFVQGIIEQAQNNVRKLQAIQELYEKLKLDFLKISGSSYVVPVLDVVFISPIFTARGIEREFINAGRKISYASLNNLLRSLVQNDYLKIIRQGRGRAKTIYSLESLVNLLSED